jgi:hypothetical protein
MVLQIIIIIQKKDNYIYYQVIYILYNMYIYIKKVFFFKKRIK